MFQSTAIVAAAAAALIGGTTVVNAAHTNSTGSCYPTWTSSKTYTDGSLISYGTTTDYCCAISGTSGTDTVGCNKGETNCVCSTEGQYGCGPKRSDSETIINNWECTGEVVRCNDANWVPGNIYGANAWTKKEVCTLPANHITPQPDLWDETHPQCPRLFTEGMKIGEGDIVTVQDYDGWYIVYQCVDGPNHAFCSDAIYAPGTGDIYSDFAWTNIGSCEGPPGSLNITDYPGYSDLTHVGGCPAEWKEGTEYDGGDRVTNGESVVYQCVDDSNANYLYCTQREPGVGLGWDQAWTEVGVCSGTIEPTASPVFFQLVNLTGCPEEWEAGTYEEGDMVSGKATVGPDGDTHLVYKCASGAKAGWCGQLGYEPGSDDLHWEDAWSVQGYCSGTITPTASPSIDPLAEPCHADWSSDEEYNEGDKVSLTVSTVPERKVSYQCRPWPYNQWCNQYKPGEMYAEQGWTVIGGCIGTKTPTSSPSFDALQEVIDPSLGSGCPSEWSASNTDYEEGDKVTLTVSDTPERKIVYQCKAWPNSGYCSQGEGYKPGTEYGKMAWNQVGYCTGTIGPTPSPTPYQGNNAAPYLCNYTKVEPSETETESCTHGTADCTCEQVSRVESCNCDNYGCSNYGADPCDSNTAAGTKTVYDTVCTKPKLVDVVYPINSYSSSVAYEAGDYVRDGRQKYRCAAHPYTGYCLQYDPTHPSELAEQGWIKEDLCPAV